MWNRICRWFMMHYVPEDDEQALADALFEIKHWEQS